MDTYRPERDITPAFFEQAAEWIDRSGEVLVILRYLRAAGARDFILCRSSDAFAAIVEAAPRGCDIEVFRDLQLPVRGVVNETFIEAALAAIPEGTEYLVITQETRPGTRMSRYSQMGESHDEFRECLEELWGAEVALGVCPEFWAEDHAGLISASKGGIDGPR